MKVMLIVKMWPQIDNNYYYDMTNPKETNSYQSLLPPQPRGLWENLCQPPSRKYKKNIYIVRLKLIVYSFFFERKETNIYFEQGNSLFSIFIYIICIHTC